MYDKQILYSVRANNFVVYAGYCLCTNGRTIENRLYEHIQAARNSDKYFRSRKDKVILACYNDPTIELTIHTEESYEIWEECNERDFIINFRGRFFDLLNTNEGIVVRPYLKFQDGSIVKNDEGPNYQKWWDENYPKIEKPIKVKQVRTIKTPPPTYTTTIPYDTAMSWAKKFWNNSTLQKGCETFDEYWIEFQKDYSKNGCVIEPE